MPDRRTVLIAIGVLAVGLAGLVVWVLLRMPAGHDATPAWSPDGASLVYVTETEGTVDLGVMRADGSDRRRIEEPGREGSPAVSPDNQSVAFDSDRDGNADIYLRRFDGSGLQRLTTHPARDWGPAWTRDGRIVFMSDRDSPGGADVYRMNADGGEIERLTRTGTARFPRPAPDGTAIALEIAGDVHVLSLPNRTLRRLTYAPQDGVRPTWSPDSRRLAFVSQRRGRPEIFTMDRDGANVEVAVSMAQGAALDPRWSPDGAYLAFVHVPEPPLDLPERAAHTIYTVHLASGRLTRLSP